MADNGAELFKVGRTNKRGTGPLVYLSDALQQKLGKKNPPTPKLKERRNGGSKA